MLPTLFVYFNCNLRCGYSTCFLIIKAANQVGALEHLMAVLLYIIKWQTYSNHGRKLYGIQLSERVLEKRTNDLITQIIDNNRKIIISLMQSDLNTKIYKIVCKESTHMSCFVYQSTLILTFLTENSYNICQ